MLVTGDLAAHGRPDEYAELAAMLKSPHPVLHVPGNHDRRGPYREKGCSVPPGDGPINRVQRVGDVRLLLLDSTNPGQDNGFLRRGDAVLVGLDAGGDV